MKKSIINKIVMASCLFAALIYSGIASASSPIPQLQSTADKIITALKNNQSSLKSNPRIAAHIVTEYLAPVVDQQAMAQAVVGRNAWNNASSAQRNQFISQFKTLVVNTYAAAFAQFSDQRVQFSPIRGGADQSRVNVQSSIISSSRPPISVSYTLSHNGSNWKIIDFSVDGVSMVQSFRSQFAGPLAQSGISGLIKSLATHNGQN